jgi:hypothetical protein
MSSGRTERNVKIRSQPMKVLDARWVSSSLPLTDTGRGGTTSRKIVVVQHPTKREK